MNSARHSGPPIDCRQVVALEPEAGYLVVIARLAHIDPGAGAAVPGGKKPGDPGSPQPKGDEILLEPAARAGQIRRDTLYLEFRRSGTPPNPAEWFDATASEAIR